MSVRVSTPPLHVERVNAFLGPAAKECDAHFRKLVTRSGVSGAMELRRLLDSPAWSRMFLRIMDRMTVEANLRVRWPREDD